MALHDDLLDLAVRLVAPSPAKTEAELRRGVSTAYYALFHFLIDVATTQGVATAALRVYVARNFEHRNMRAVCARYAGLATDKAGHPVPPELQSVADAFVQLQEARHNADYNVKGPVTLIEAQTSVQMARDALVNWAMVAAHPATDVFLTELLVGGIKER